MKWTYNKPEKSGYYWYKGPVTADQLKKWDRIKEKEKFCTIAKLNNSYDNRVEFLGFTVKRKMKKIPNDALWCGPIPHPDGEEKGKEKFHIERCETCKYAFSNEPITDTDYLFCKRYPPMGISYLAKIGAETGAETNGYHLKELQPEQKEAYIEHEVYLPYMYKFPVMEKEGWCGEYKP